MSRLTVFFGGSVGSDPQSEKTWSGISRFLLSAMDRAGILDRAVGIKVPRLHNSFLLAKSFNRNRSVWRSHYYFDPAYRRALTHAAKRVSVTNPVLLQIGHMFSLPDAFPDKKCISYHDGNLAVRLNSGFGLAGVSPRRIDQALRYEEQMAGQMTAVFTFSEYLRHSFISDYHVPAERVFNVGGGVNLTEFPSPAPHKDYSEPRILFIGTDFARKGGIQLLQAFRMVREAMPGAELHIAGPAKLMELPPGVVFHGHLSKDDPYQNQELESLFRDSTLFVLPSLYEPFGIMKQGTAIIIGAGPAGLTAAIELQRQSGIKPILIEASHEIGGISRTVRYKGNRMDIGGHRFFSKSDRVMRWWLD
jgi:alpha-maltose-1-phosphate synthase